MALAVAATTRYDLTSAKSSSGTVATNGTGL
jgi:hypothetical protein